VSVFDDLAVCHQLAGPLDHTHADAQQGQAQDWPRGQMCEAPMPRKVSMSSPMLKVK
jgi:hypothetical protein